MHTFISKNIHCVPTKSLALGWMLEILLKAEQTSPCPQGSFCREVQLDIHLRSASLQLCPVPKDKGLGVMKMATRGT